MSTNLETTTTHHNHSQGCGCTSDRRDSQFAQLVESMQESAVSTIGTCANILVFTDQEKDDLFNIFIENVPEDLQGYLTCNTCRYFMNTFGGIVGLREGRRIPLMWRINESTPEIYHKALTAIADKVANSRIKYPFYTDKRDVVLGISGAGGFDHFKIDLHRTSDVGFGDESDALEAVQQYKALAQTLFRFSHDVLDTALSLFENEERLYFYESHRQRLKMFIELRKTVEAAEYRPAVIWDRIIRERESIAYIGNQVIGTFLQALTDNDNTEEGQRAARNLFLSMVNPRDYQRPTGAPSREVIAQAEAYFAEHGYGASLKRRYLRRAEIPDNAKIFTAKASEDAEPKGIFENIVAHNEKSHAGKPVIQGRTLTWTQFIETVIPDAHRLFVELESNMMYPFLYMGTAEDESAPPILKWDDANDRNPVAAAVVMANRDMPATPPQYWGLQQDELQEIDCIIPHPEYWKNLDHDEAKALSIIVLKNGYPRESLHLDLIGPYIRNDLWKYRSVIEAYNAQATMAGDAADTICGMVVSIRHAKIGNHFTVEYEDGRRIRHLVDRGF